MSGNDTNQSTTVYSSKDVEQDVKEAGIDRQAGTCGILTRNFHHCDHKV